MNNKLAVVFPGMGYGKDKPLLYYAARLVKARGYEVRYVDYEGLAPLAGNTRADKVAWTKAAYDIAAGQLADIDWAGREIVFIAKSVGTVIASQYANLNGLKPLMLLLTPLNETFEFLCGGRNFLFTGENDPWIDLDRHKDAIDENVEEVFFFSGANHSLEHVDVDDDIETLRECMRQIAGILRV